MKIHKKKTRFDPFIARFIRLKKSVSIEGENRKWLDCNLAADISNTDSINNIMSILLLDNYFFKDVIIDSYSSQDEPLSSDFLSCLENVKYCVQQSEQHAPDQTLIGRYDYARIMYKHLAEADSAHDLQRISSIKSGQDDHLKKDLASYKAWLENQQKNSHQNTKSASQTK